MMAWLVSLSLRHRIVVVVLAALMVVMAWRTVRTASLDVFPEFAPPLIEVQTEAPGLSTTQVEALVTVPLEAALNGVPGLDGSDRSRCWGSRQWCSSSIHRRTCSRPDRSFRSVWPGRRCSCPRWHGRR